MTRTVIIVLTFFAAILIFTTAILLISEQTLPDNARVALTKYLQYRDGLTIQQFTHATLPSKLTRDLSGTSFGDSVFYRTMVDYRMVPVIELPNLATATPGWTKTPYFGEERPIPFPPEDVWCILLKGESEPQQIVFVALHQGLYNADWLVHEPTGAKNVSVLNQDLSNIGCEMKLGD